MDKCYYYLSNGLWKIAEKYFDPENEIQRQYFFGMAVAPNQYSFRSHIVATPWQQSWMTINILKNAEINFIPNKDENAEPIDLNIVKKEIDFQYTLRNYASDSFVQDLFNIYSKIQSNISVNYNEAELKIFNSKLKIFIQALLKECPSTAHTLFCQLLQEQFFVNSCEILFHEVNDDSALCNLIFSSFCQNEMIKFHIPYVMGLLQNPFRKNLCYLLLAHDNISLLHAMLEEDKKLFLSSSRKRLQNFMENGLQPFQCFFDMTLMERHFLLQIFDMINGHLDELPVLIKCANIPFFIWPVILLQNWNNNSLSDEFLLQLIEKCKESTKDKAITQITYILEWYINFSKWYEKHESSENKEEIGNKQNLLEKAKDHSVLYLINNTTDLSETNWSQIRDLLKQGKSKSESEESWDLVLFDSYCILMKVLRAIVLSMEIDQLAKLQKVKLTDISFFNEIFNSMYKEEVTVLLKEVKEKLHVLYPLTFRLEILENVFALIFITYEDVKKLSYFTKGCLNVEKYIEKVQISSNPIEKSNNKLQRNLSCSGPPVLLTEKNDEESTNRKQKLKGFICKKYILRDLIYLVKECLEVLEEDPGGNTQAGNISIDVPCSITSGQMENRLDRLLESVSEATWRLQLVTDADFISQEGTMQYACGQDPFHHFEGEWIYLPHDLDKIGGLKMRKKSADKQNDSGTHSNSSPGNGTASESHATKRQTPGPAIMNQMLACDSSLVVHCLSQGDILNADHIIQMMSTEENRQNLEGELNFTRAVNDLKKKLQNISLESPVRKSGVESGSQSRSLQTIQIIANQGVTSTALTNQIERFLSAYTLPSIQSHSKVSAGSVLQCIENTTAMVIIDLALTMPLTFQEFRDLLNIASKHCPELSTRIQSPISAQSGSIKPLGYIVFTQNMIALLQEINRNKEIESEISLQQFLRSHQYPFSLKALKDNLNFWNHLKIVFTDFDRNVEESKSLATCKEGLLVKCQKNIKETQNIFERITKLTENCNDFMDFGKQEAPAGEIIKSVNYCDLVSRYLTDLSVFVLENICSKTEDLIKPITLHNLLEQSAVDIVDKLIFDYHIEPSVLEKKAQQLGFNLTASLITGCCPNLPQNCETPENLTCIQPDRIVLNALNDDYQVSPLTEPNAVVENILSELLTEFQKYLKVKEDKDHMSKLSQNLLTESDLSKLRNDKKIQKILEKTQQVNFVELKKLKDLEFVVFFTNLLNLIMCHCYLSSKLEKTDGVFSKYSFYRDLGYAFLGYNVGELGFLSIVDVKQKLLGDNLDTWISPGSNEAWKCVLLTPDPRLIFTTINFKSSSPPLAIFKCNDFDMQVTDSVDKYVQAFVSVKGNSVLISDLLEMYLNEVFLSDCYENETKKVASQTERNKLFLKFLMDHSSSKLQEQLNDFSSSDMILEIISPHKEVMLKLDHNVIYPEQKVEEKPSEKWLNRTLSDSILRHFSQNSRILADIVYKIHEAKSSGSTEVGRDVLLEEKLKYLDHLLNAPWLPKIAPLFNENTVIAALCKNPEEQNVVNFFEKCVSEKDWFKCLDVLFALPDYYVSSNLNVKRFKDLVLREATLIASKDGKENPWYYSQHISEVNIRLQAVVECCQFWPGNVCTVELSSILRDNLSLSPHQREDIKNLIKKIKIYNAVLDSAVDLEAETWFDVFTFARLTPDVIIKSLMKNNQLELCLQWFSLPGILSSIQQFIDSDLIVLFFEHLHQEVNLVDQLLESLPNTKLHKIYREVLLQLTSIPAIENLVQRAQKTDPSPLYKMVETSLIFLSQLDSEEQSLLVHLKSYPFLIIEQLLMNTKLEALDKVLKKARDIKEELINQDEINKLLVSYAVKAIEFNVVKPVKNSERVQSFLIGGSTQINQEQTIPSEVPDKSQWIPDNTVTLCMCCRLVTFSMFNRRHHCRRCGKVICGTCSVNRIKVDGYKGVAVRVCQNCFLHYTKAGADVKCSQPTATFDSSNFIQDFYHWKLSTDESKNVTLRDEFCYEHSPDVTLCLAIFNLISDSSYYGVLLEESEKMLKILQLNGKAGNPEIDCGVAIQIIRSLILGAKVKYAHAGLISNVDYCDQLLSQVDILQILVNNHCASLIPSEPLNTATLRCLRDKLVEEEQWELAMEVSTKCGLDRNWVWGAWGKVCLAAGSWDDARIKFSYCLTPFPKPSRNPPLVDEICRILEAPNVCISGKSVQKQPDRGAVAQEITQVLSTLKLLSQGKALIPTAVHSKNSIQYEEEIFYLSTYGSHQALLSFYLKRNEFKAALTHLLKEQLEPELFLEYLLLPSYETHRHENLKSEMLGVDPSLESFKKYLTYACVYMQKVGYLHTLHDIQILMQDYLRATVTCTLLYQKNATNFTSLVSRSDYLLTAIKHLEEELFALNKKTKRLDCIMQMDTKTINHHMNTIWRQLEAAKFLAAYEAKDKFALKDLFSNDALKENAVLTLFGGNTERSAIVKMIVVCGKNISEGFGIAFRIIQDHQLDIQSICVEIGKKLAEEMRIDDIRALLDCLKTLDMPNYTTISDAMVASVIPVLARSGAPTTDLEALTKLIKNVNLKINAFIETRQLVPAYILAVKHNRLDDVQRIMEVADQKGLTIIKKICLSKLNQSSECSSNEEFSTLPHDSTT